MDALDFYELARTPQAIALTLVVAVVYPLISFLRFRALERSRRVWTRARKLRLYASTIATQWTLVGATALVLGAVGGGLGDVGQHVGAAGKTLPAIALLLVWFAVLSVVTLRQLSRVTSGELPSQIVRTSPFLPSDRVESAAYVALAITAGVCEEILYRGWLQTHLEAWIGSAFLGVVLSALVFGFAHAYQGRRGMVMSGALGLLLGSVASWTGSLVPGQILHVAIDLVNGFAIARTMRRLAGGSIDAPAGAPVDSGP